MERFSPKIDVVFRKLFGSEQNKDILISLINSIISPRIVVKDIEICNPYNLAAYVGSKESILDIKAVDQSGVFYNVEMQVAGRSIYGKRALYNASKVLVDQLDEGMPFSAINTTIGIHLLDFDFFRDARYFRHFQLLDTESHETCEQLSYLQIYFIEMKKFGKQYNEITAPLDRWIAFLNHAEELRQGSLPEPLGQEPAIIKAVRELEIMGLDTLEREIYNAEVMEIMVDKEQLEYARQEARQEAKEELLSLQIEQRFSTMPDHITRVLDSLTSDQMNELGKALFSFASLSDLESWLSGR